MLEIQNVSKSYGPTRALQGVSLSIPPARTTVLIGPSGCGKSTLLRLVIGLLSPEAGRILLDGRTLEAGTLIEMRRRMGYVIQDGGLFPHLRARDNIVLMARYLGWAPGRLENRLDELCALTQLDKGLLDRYPAQLSGGQCQRVSLMRALMLDPDLLLLDEPLGALDPMIRFDMQSELKEIFRSLGKTVVMVTHDLGEAAFLGDQIVLMRDGGIVQQGTIGEFASRPADPFVTSFVNARRSPLDEVSVEGVL